MGFFNDVDVTTIMADTADDDSVVESKKKSSDEELNEDAELMEELLGNFSPLDDDSDLEDDDDSDLEDEEINDIAEPAPVHQTEHKSAVTKKPLPSKEQVNHSKTRNREVKTKPPVSKSVPFSSSTPKSTGEKNVILPGTTVGGGVFSEGDIEIGGRIDGDVEATGNIRLLPNAVIHGNASGSNIFVEGKITGKVTGNDVSLTGPGIIKGGINSLGNISVGEGSSVIGDILSEEDIIINGGIKGNIEVKNMVTVKSTAIIQGNIVSALVSIEPGAALDGTCTQAYAKISPAEYFANMDNDAE